MVKMDAVKVGDAPKPAEVPEAPEASAKAEAPKESKS
jgi:hypothetical protein